MGTVDDFLAAVEAGKGAGVAGLYSDDAVLDATVPNWRFTKRGGEAIAAEYARWFADPAQFRELDRHSTADAELITYFLTWVEDGVPHGAHHSHLISVDKDSGLITYDRVFCGGRWNGDLLGQMEAAERGE